MGIDTRRVGGKRHYRQNEPMCKYPEAWKSIGVSAAEGLWMQLKHREQESRAASQGWI